MKFFLYPLHRRHTRPMMAGGVGVLLLAGLVVSAFVLTPAAEAFWPFSQKPVEDPAEALVRTFQPPPENAVALRCEPYRREAALLYQKPRLAGLLYQPRRAWLIKQHRRCRQELMAQEYLYLKHADVEQPPAIRPEAIAPKTEASPQALPNPAPQEVDHAGTR